MKIARLVLAIMLLAVGFAWSSRPAPAAANGMLYTCASLNDPAFDDTYYSTLIGPVQLKAGDTITLIADWVEGPPDGQFEVVRVALVNGAKINLFFDGVLVASAPFPGTLVYTVPADVVLTTMEWLLSNEDWAAWQVSCGAGVGCDMLIQLTEDAAVGAFVADAPLYWAPGKLTDPLLTIPAGKTAWVLGQDASGAYYKIVWVCNLLWVPKETMGPNYDAVWNGTPLPTSVVD